MNTTNTQSSMPETSFIDLLKNNTFIVPEIQREYVWGSDSSLIEQFIKSIKAEENINIGFLYSYTPSHTVTGQKYSYLIDGQQRFTTLYILALYTSLKEGKEAFYVDSLYEKFSYRVRQTTEQFLKRLMIEAKSLNDLQNIKEKTWFLDYYKQDISIMNMVALIEKLQTYEGELPNFEQVCHVTFYNFNIAAAGQGEELYITMNSRGEKIQDNETLRAYLFGKPDLNGDDLHKWAKDYDNWQEFFWQRRGNNPTADKGFNEFIKWCITIENHEKNSFKNPNEVIIKEHFSLLNFEKISKYHCVLEKVIAEKIDKTNYPKVKIEELLAGNVDNYVLTLPLLKLLVENNGIANDNVNFHRWAHFFYNIAYNKGSQALQAALDLVQYIVKEQILDPIGLLECDIKNILLDDEERAKLSAYKSNPDIRDDIRKSFAELEESKILKGCIKPFIDKVSENTDKKFNKEEFEEYKKVFLELFGNPDDVSDLTRRALLTFENYTITASWSWKIYAECWSLCENASEWSKSWHSKHAPYFELFTEIIKRKGDCEEPLEEIIKSYKENTPREEDFYRLIVNPKVLEYSKSKRLAWSYKEDSITHILLNTQVRGDEGVAYKKYSDFDC